MSLIRTFDAIVIAGGRGSRLGGVDKPALRIDGVSLLERALEALEDARRVSVVRPVDDVPLDARVSRVVEDPPLSGPASAIAAGLADLARTMPGGAAAPASLPSFVVILAADLLRAGGAIAALRRHAMPAHSSGLMAVDPAGRDQPLLAIYRTVALQTAVDAQSTDGLGVSQLIAGLPIHRVPLDARWCADIDDEADARAAGIRLPAGRMRIDA